MLFTLILALKAILVPAKPSYFMLPCCLFAREHQNAKVVATGG